MEAERRVALVTGGTRGIGLGIARRLARDGFHLAVNGVRAREEVEDAVDELRGLGAEVEYARGDVSDDAERVRIVDTVRERFGRLHVLVNNAGAASRDRGVDPLEGREDHFAWLLRVNLHGPWFLTQLVARWMIEQRLRDEGFTGCIVNVTSISAEVVSATRGDYCVSKAALSMATKVWAERLAPEAISVFEVRPGIVRTDMTAPVAGKYDRFIAAGGLIESRWGTPDDVGRVVAMLARGELPYAPGQVLTVDGGLSMKRL